ncbi:MAG TPA: type II toxin-antitoxin system VapC family toxin [Actinomycetota bacterium]
MGLSVLDSSVIIAFRDSTDRHHAASVSLLKETAASDALVVPVIVYAEVLVGAIRKGRSQAATAERFFRDATRLEPATPDIARTAARIRAQHGVRLPDALVIATGVELEADQILTADSRWKRVDPRVRVIG